MSRTIQTIFSPSLFNQVEDLDKKIVVIIDILRATSTICTMLESGAQEVITVASEQDARALAKTNGFILAGERNGEKLEGFDMGNSPLEALKADIDNQKIVLTTTNGTRCIHMAREAKSIIIGSFLNLSAVCNYIDDHTEDVVLFCAGWKDRINMEDSLFAGAVCMGLDGDYQFDDSSLLAQSAYAIAEDDLYRHLQSSNHFQRLSRLNVEDDIRYCCEIDQFESVPTWNGESIQLIGYKEFL